MRHGRFWLAALLFLGLASAVLVAARQDKPAAKAGADEEPTADELRDLAVVKRFREVLEKNPRRGTALDRIYGHHVERGTLDKLVAEYTARTAKDPADGVAWMTLGLIESQRGRDAAAVAGFRQAETHLPGNAIPPYYLGISLVLVGQPEAAAEAFERAILRKPIRTDLLDIFQALGRVYQRGQRTEKALDVWNRLEKLFPDDARVQEQITTTLIEEGQYEQALPRLEKLIKATDDKYRQSTLKMDLAELKVKLKKTPEALADFEAMLADLNPDNWLYRDVRKRVEDVYLRNDDLAGLAKYYEAWLVKNPTDVDAIARLAKNLSGQGRAVDAKGWLEKGIAVAPSNRGLRQALIDQYAYEQNFPAVVAQFEAMEKADPNNPDTLREWGKAVLKDPSKPEADRKVAAVAVWKRMLEKKPNDPVMTAQVADLMRAAGVTDDALALYKRAVELAPAAAQYREYLGEYYHSLKKSDDALATWKPIAEGANRTPKNLVRLAEVFAGFGYRKEAVAAMRDAVALEKDDFGNRMTFADLLLQELQFDPALAELAAAQKLVSNPEEAEQVLLAEIKVYTTTEKLGDRIAALRLDLDAGKDPTADRFHRLARYYEANRQADEATAAIGKAQEKDPKSVIVTIAAARILEAGGNMLAAADANRRLAAIDRRFRTEYLQNVAKLEQRLGRREQALQAGRDLLAASPGNPDTYKFYAELCFQLGDMDEGLEALRRSVRANPAEPQGLITLANALVERVRQGEAIELLWRAFEKTPELEGRLSVIDRLTQLYLENNQFDRLVERLERERREAEKTREMTMCLAQAYQSAGDLGTARVQLERLLTENSRDTGLLGQLSTLCEAENDNPAAVKYQKQLAAAAPANVDHQLRLAQLLVKLGESDEAADIWVKLAAADPEAHRNLQSIDQLAAAQKYDPALAILTRLLVQKPIDWELVYREGAILAAKGKTEDAAKRFQALLGMKLLDDEDGAIAKNAAKKKQAKKGVNATAAVAKLLAADGANNPPLVKRVGNSYSVRRAVGVDPPENYGGQQQQSFYAPDDFGEARMAALGWLYGFARKTDAADKFAKQIKTAAAKPNADPRAIWDWYYLQTLRGEYRGVFDGVKGLSAGTDPAGQLVYLMSLPTRNEGKRQYRRPGAEDQEDKVPALPPDQLEYVLTTFKKLKTQRPDWVTNDIAMSVMTELKRAKRGDEEKAMFASLMATAATTEKVQTALGVAMTRDDLDAVLALYAKLEQLQGPAKNASSVSQLPTRQAVQSLEYLVAKRADAKKFPDVLKLLDLALTTARRQNLAAPKSTSSKRGNRNGLNGNVPGKGARNFQVTFPSPNEYYDELCCHLMYTSFAKFKDADLLSDLFAHYRKQLAPASGAEKLYFHLAIGYLHWWSDEKDEALAELAAAVAAAPADVNLLLEVADLREKNNEADVALAMLDSVTPLDTQMMQRREESALRLAEKTGNIDRARQAAERLFGLRLDSEKQVELAGQMHRLGMHELAETVMNRAQRQGGNKTATLLRLMNQYQTQNQTDQAVAIARQILRKSSGPRTPNPNGNDDGDNTRNQAIAVLARSGQLKDMIERAEAQLKASPKSAPIYQTLIDYYQAGNEKVKLKAAVLKLAELKPDDAKVRFAVAQQLQRIGEPDAAIEQYKIAIKKEPELFGNRYWEVQQLFTQQNKYEELVQLFDDMDLRKVGRYWTVIEMVQPLMQNEKTKEIGLRLFRKAWAAFPEYRPYMLGNLNDEQVWRTPEMYEFAKQAMLPKVDDDGGTDGADMWAAATQIVSYGQEGRVDGVLSRMLSVARKQQRMPELRAEIAAVLAKKPDWHAGKGLLAVIDIQTGNKARGMAMWEEVFGDKKIEVPPLARFILAQELEYYAGVEAIALKTLEAGADEMIEDGSQEYSYSPIRRLVWLYDQAGRPADAKALRIKAMKGGKDPGYGGGYWQYRKINSAMNVANELIQKGDAVEAVRIYNELLADRDGLQAANQYYGGEQYDKQVEQGLRNAITALKPASLPAAVATLLTARAAADRGAIDLLLLVDSRDLTQSTMTSMLATAVKSTEKSPAVRAAAVAKIADLVAKHPKDFSVQIAAALVAFADDKKDATAAAVDRLVKLIDAVPLEALPPAGRANSRQRAAAMEQVPLWLVARECLDTATHEKAGERLAARAITAARRQADTSYAAAILREWGNLLVEYDDAPGAAAKWAELLEIVLPKPSLKKPTPAAAPPGAKPAAPATPIPPAAAVPVKMGRAADDDAAAFLSRCVFCSADLDADDDERLALAPQVILAVPLSGSSAKGPAGSTPAVTGGKSGVPVPSAQQFDHAIQVANLAADQELVPLSIKAVTDALKGGPPTPSQNGNGRRSYYIQTASGVYEEVTEGGGGDVYAALNGIVPKWKKLKVPPAEVYAVLLSAVLPDSRPAEVFTYSSGGNGGYRRRLYSGGSFSVSDGGNAAGRGLSDMLCEYAVAAGKADDLRQRLAGRAKQPLGDLPAKVMLMSLAREEKNDAKITESLTALAERLKKDTTAATAQQVTEAVRPLLKSAPHAAAAVAAFEQCAANHVVGQNPSGAEQIRVSLANYYLEKKDEPAAWAQFAKVADIYKKGGANDDAGVQSRLADQYLRAGWLDESLASLAGSADEAGNAAGSAKTGPVMSEPVIGNFTLLLRMLLKLPAAKRYDALRAWTLPVAGRKALRYVTGATPGDLPPAAFGTFPGIVPNEYVSTMTLLIDAAKEAGKLPELCAEADKFAADKIEHAELFRVLAHLKAGTAKTIEPAVKAYSEATLKRLTTKPEPQVGRNYYGGGGQEQSPPLLGCELAFTLMCLKDAALIGHGERLLLTVLSKATGSLNAPQIVQVRKAWDGLGATRAGAPNALANGVPAGWTPADKSAVWFAQDGYLTLGWADVTAMLVYDAPVSGTFEFQVDAYQGTFAEGHVGYAGLICEPNRPGVESVLYPIGRQGADSIVKTILSLKAEGFNTFTVKVSPKSVKYLVNGELFYEDTDPSPTSPWLTMYAGNARRPVFRNFKLTGTPTFPAEIPLVSGDYLDGWRSNSGLTIAPRLTPKEIAKAEAEAKASGTTVTPVRGARGRIKKKPAEDAVYTYSAKAGEITGRKDAAPTGKASHALFQYFRPLKTGEGVKYDFYYQPGDVLCSPAVGNVALMLDPDGVQTRWLGTTGDWTGIDVDNVFPEPGNRRGPAKLPLKPNDWNSAKVTLTADAVTVELNGTVVCERKLDAGLETTFGFYHDKDKTGFRVKNIVLSGPWAKAAAAGSFATTPATPTEAKARRWQLGEKFYFTEAGDIVAAAAKLPPAEAYAKLAGWVLPTPSRPAFQVAGVVTAQDVIGFDPKTPPAAPRTLLGGKLEAPVLAMVGAAKAAGKLDELAAAVEAAPADDDLTRRGRLATLVAVRAAQGKTDAAAAAVKELTAFAKAMRPDAGPADRWPDLIAATASVNIPGLAAARGDLVAAMNANIEAGMLNNIGFDNNEWWHRQYRIARAAGVPAGDGFRHWVPLVMQDSWTRANGWGVPRWVTADGVLRHHPGHQEDYLALRTPVRGNFTLTAELQTLGWSEGHVLYGGTRIDLSHDRKQAMTISGVGGTPRNSTLVPAMPASPANNRYKYELAVLDGVMVAKVDGREIGRERVGPRPDPWLMLHSFFQNTAEFRNVTITGTPTVPASIDLIGDDMTGWKPYLGDAWGVRGEEMFHAGMAPEVEEGKPAPPRGQPEQALFYHRPFVEDGAVNYECYYEAGKANVSPTLDRLTFQFEPDGVKLHRLTDGPHDRTGTAIDNVVDEPKNRRGPAKLPLKEKAWNAVTLAVVGDVVKVSLNGVPVYERPIETTNQRYFGLFHYQDRTEARVRSVVLTGDWPKAVPAAAELFAPGK